MKKVLICALLMMTYGVGVYAAQPTSIAQFAGTWDCQYVTGSHGFGDNATFNVVEKSKEVSTADGRTQSKVVSKIILDFAGKPVVVTLNSTTETVSRLEGNKIYSQVISYSQENREASQPEKITLASLFPNGNKKNLESNQENFDEGLKAMGDNLGTKTERSMKRRIKKKQEVVMQIDEFSPQAYKGHVKEGNFVTSAQCTKVKNK